MNTGRYLHSHLHQSPLSRNQEVSCFINDNGLGDTGDNWMLLCEPGVTHWTREAAVRLQHQDTGKFLMSSAHYKYNHPIPGQQEVYCSKPVGNLVYWFAQEGIYVGDRGFFDRTADDDEEEE